MPPTHLAQNKKGDPAASRHKRQRDSCPVFPKPFARLEQTAPSGLKSRAHQRKGSAHNCDNSRRGHNHSVYSCQPSRGTTLRGVPIDEAKQCHKKERFRVGGDEEECCRVREDEERPTNLKRTRNSPAPAEQEEISPKTPRSELSGDQKRRAGVDVECISQQRSNRRVCREKCDIRDFHHLMIDRRDDRLISAIDNVHEPIAVVLNQRGVALGHGLFWSEQNHRHYNLQKRNGKSREHRRKEARQAGHYMIIAEGNQPARETLNAAPTFSSRFSDPDPRLRRNDKPSRMPTTCEAFGSGNLGSHRFQLISVTGFDGGCDSFIRLKLAKLL